MSEAVKPGPGQTWRVPLAGDRVLTRRHENNNGWRFGDGPNDWHDDYSFRIGTLTYVRGPASTVAKPGERWDEFAIGQRWGGVADGASDTDPWVILEVSPLGVRVTSERAKGGGGVWYFRDHLVDCDMVEGWVRLPGIDVPEASKSREGAAGLAAGVDVAKAPSSTPGVKQASPPPPIEITPVPCPHGCGAPVAYPSRHQRYGRWDCVRLGYSAAEIGLCRGTIEGGGR